MNWKNYDSVLAQLQGAGLLVDGIDVGTPKPKRVKVEGEGREERGWYWLNDILLDDGAGNKDAYIVGAFGVYHGNDNGKQSVKLNRDKNAPAITDDQKAAIAARQKENRSRMKAMRNSEIERAASQAGSVWRKYSTDGVSDYLVRKGVGAHGLRFAPVGNGTVAVPMTDASGKVWGLQIIRGKDRGNKLEKQYWPKGLQKQGHYHLIGGTPRGLVLIAEGYATAASLFEATNLPVVVAFDAGNLLPVTQAIKKAYPKAKILVCADDDYLTPGNPGITAAQSAAHAINGATYLVPVFSAERPQDKKGPTDFNDLHALEGLHTVRAQVEASLRSLGWEAQPAPARREVAQGGAGEKLKLKPLIGIDEAAQRFALIYGMGGKSLFDFQECRVVHKDEMLNITPERAWNDIKRHPDWRAFRDSEVGFDPDGSQPEIICNLYSGWPTVPKKGKCDAILDLLKQLCSHETGQALTLYSWILCWMAYPIQNPGAKMQTAVIVHGDQGAGKNTFFSKAWRPIYGKYGVEFGQTAMEEKFNGWMSGILAGIGNEVIASREELYHVKGKIKNMITEPSWQIRSMHQDARMERNCCNFVFFSNDLNALHLDPHDRRFCVIWTPHTPQPGESAYDTFRQLMAEVYDELENGGSEAFHDYLLRVDISKFGVSTPPPMTKAKESLIELNLDSKERFLREWMEEGIGNIPCTPVPIELLYELYREWCQRTGIRNASPMHTFAAQLYSKPHVKREQTKIQIGLKVERKTVVYASGITDHPPEKSKSIWLGDCAETFKTHFDAWKGDK